MVFWAQWIELSFSKNHRDLKNSYFYFNEQSSKGKFFKKGFNYFEGPQNVLYIRVAWFSTFCDLQNWIHSCRSGIFLGVQFKKQALGKLCQIVIGPLFRNFTFKCCSFTWRRATKKFDFYHKMGNNKKLCFIHF